MRTYYQIFVNSVYGSDVLEADTLKEAISKAEDWQRTTDEEVVVLECTEKEINWRKHVVIYKKEN